MVSHLRVLDLCHDLAGSYCARLLAGMGATVIKIERPAGATTRVLRPATDGSEPGRLSPHLDAGKLGVTLDIESPRGRDLLLRLVEQADVVVEAYAPGSLDELNMGFTDMSSVNPSVILTSITPFGQNGPYSHYRTTEIGVHAMSGEMYLAGQPHQPLKKGGNIAQYLGGLNGFIGAMGAVFHRQRTRRGQHVDVSLVESLASIIGQALREEAQWGYIPGRRQGGLGWPNNIYECADGYAITFTAYAAGDSWWREFAELICDGEDIEIPAAPPRDGEALAEWDGRFKTWLGHHTKREIHEQGQKRGLAFGYLATPGDLLKSSQLEHRRFFRDSDVASGGAKLMNLPFLVDGERLPLSLAPLRGEHNEEVYGGLLEIGPTELQDLKQQGVI